MIDPKIIKELKTANIVKVSRKIKNYRYEYTIETKPTDDITEWYYIYNEIPKEISCRFKPSQISDKNLKLKLVKDFCKANIENKPYSLESGVEEAFAKYIKSQRKRLYSEMVKDIYLVTYMTRENIIPLSDIDEVVKNTEDVEIKAILIDYSHKNFTSDDRFKLMIKEFNKNPNSISEMKKLWSWDVKEDGTLIITGYKGEETDITIPATIGKYKVSEINLNTNRRTVHNNRNQIKSVVISEGVSKIGENCFYYFRNLEHITIPNSVTEIGKCAFESTWIREVTIPNTATVECGVFEACYKLKIVNIPKTVTHIKSAAFIWCLDLEEINYEGTKEEWKNIKVENYNTELLDFPKINFESYKAN